MNKYNRQNKYVANKNFILTQKNKSFKKLKAF